MVSAEELTFILRMRDEATAVVRKHADELRNAGGGAKSMSDALNAAGQAINRTATDVGRVSDALTGSVNKMNTTLGAVSTTTAQVSGSSTRVAESVSKTTGEVDRQSKAIGDLTSKMAELNKANGNVSQAGTVFAGSPPPTMITEAQMKERAEASVRRRQGQFFAPSGSVDDFKPTPAPFSGPDSLVAPGKVAGGLTDVVTAARGAAVAITGVWAATAIGRQAVTAFKDTEKAITDVKNAARLSGEQLTVFRTQFDALSNKLGAVSESELYSIATVAAKIGAEGPEGIAKFTDALGTIGLAANGQGAAYANMVAGILQSTRESVSGVDGLAKALTFAEKNSKLFVGEITELTSRMAVATQAFNFSSASLVGFAAAAGSLNLKPAEMANVVTKAITELNTAANNGGEAMRYFTNATQMTSDQLRQLIDASPEEAVIKLFEVIQRAKSAGQGQSALDVFGLGGLADQRIVGSLVGNIETLRQSIAKTREAAAAPGAVPGKEVAALNDSLGRISKAWGSLMSQLSESVAPETVKTLNTASQVLDILTNAVKTTDAALNQFSGNVVGFTTVLTSGIPGITAYRGALYLLQMAMGKGSSVKVDVDPEAKAKIDAVTDMAKRASATVVSIPVATTANPSAGLSGVPASQRSVIAGLSNEFELGEQIKNQRETINRLASFGVSEETIARFRVLLEISERQLNPLGEITREISEQARSAGAYTDELKGQLEIQQKIESYQERTGNKSAAAAEAIRVKMAELQGVIRAVNFNETVKGLNDALRASQAMTQAAREQLEIENKIRDLRTANKGITEADAKAMAATMAATNANNNLRAARDAVNPQAAAARAAIDLQKTFNGALDSGNMKQEEFLRLTKQLEQSTLAARDPVAGMVRDMQEQVQLASKTGDYYAADQKTLQTVIELKRQGVDLDKQSQAALESYNRNMQDAAKAMSSGFEGWSRQVGSIRDGFQDINRDFASGLSQGISSALQGKGQQAVDTFLQNMSNKVLNIFSDQLVKGGLNMLGLTGGQNGFLDAAKSDASSITGLLGKSVATMSVTAGAIYVNGSPIAGGLTGLPGTGGAASGVAGTVTGLNVPPNLAIPARDVITGGARSLTSASVPEGGVPFKDIPSITRYDTSDLARDDAASRALSTIYPGTTPPLPSIGWNATVTDPNSFATPDAGLLARMGPALTAKAQEMATGMGTAGKVVEDALTNTGTGIDGKGVDLISSIGKIAERLDSSSPVVGAGGKKLFDFFGAGGALTDADVTSGVLQHKGGVYGENFPTMNVPWSAVNGAPRHHKGLSSDEYVAVLQKSERVLTGEQDRRNTAVLKSAAAAAGGNSGPGMVNNNIVTSPTISITQSGSSGDPAADARHQEQTARQVKDAVSQAVSDQLMDQMRPGGMLYAARPR